jgi:hypothetical protein
MERKMAVRYTVKQDGNLEARNTDSALAASVSVPVKVLSEGPAAVSAHVTRTFKQRALVEKLRRQKRVEKMRANPVGLSVEVSGQPVEGVLRYSETRTGLFYVDLMYPVKYATTTQIHGSMARARSGRNVTHDADGEWLPEIVSEAEDTLRSLYNRQLHREKFAYSYEVAAILNQ